MHIAYADPQVVPGVTPPAMQILQTVDALAQCGVRVTLITAASPSACSAEDILGRPLHPGVTALPIDDWRDRWWYPSRSGRRFYSQCRRLLSGMGDVDGVLVRNLKLADVLLGAKRLPPLVFETHEVFARTFADEHRDGSRKNAKKFAALKQREARVYSGCQGIAALTRPLIDDIVSDYPDVAPQRVVPDGVDAAMLEIEIPVRAAHDRDPKLLYLGSLHPWKGVDKLVRALPAVRRGRLVIAGGTPQRIAETSRLAQSLNVADRVDFLGAVPPARRFEIIADADVCLLPLGTTSIASRYTSPLKLFEYMSMGKPIVSADVPSIREVMTSGVDGLLTPVDDSAALSNAINAIIDDPVLARTLGDGARRRVADFTWVRRAEGLIELFRSLKDGDRCAA